MKSKRPKFYYSVEFDIDGTDGTMDVGGFSYVIAVSKQAALQQIKRYSRTQERALKYSYRLDTLKRISKRDYDAAHEQ